MLSTRILTTAALIAVTASASAWWGGGPWGGNNWGNNYNNGFGRGYGGLGGEQYRGGDASGGGDFGMNLSGRGNTNLRGYGSGYGAGDGWGRGYHWSRPFYGGYGPHGYGRPPVMGAHPAYALPAPAGTAGTGFSGYNAARDGGGQPQRTGGPVAAGAAQAASAASDIGIVTDAAGMTLYTYAQDSIGLSNCYGQCASNWPPALVVDDAALTEGLTAVTRRDGSRQLALDGKPLYFRVGDKKPGDTTGDGVGGVWSVARR